MSDEPDQPARRREVDADDAGVPNDPPGPDVPTDPSGTVVPEPPIGAPRSDHDES